MRISDADSGPDGMDATERALRLSEPLPAEPITIILTVAVIAVGVLLLIGILVP
jgi:hypothetical protein